VRHKSRYLPVGRFFIHYPQLGVYKKADMARSSDAVFPLSLIQDKAFQMRQIRRVLWLTLFFVVQSTIVLGLFYHYLLGEMVAGTAPLLFASEDLQLLTESVPSTKEVMMRWIIIMLAINALVTIAIGVYIMRKLGSPVLAIRRALNELGDGNLEVRLRSGDAQEFSELSDSLNRALEQIQSKVEQARQPIRILDNLEQQPRPDAREIEQALIKCRDALDYFDKRGLDGQERPAANG